MAARPTSSEILGRQPSRSKLSASTITVQVSDETRHLYDQIVSNTGATDEDIEIHLRTALADVLKNKIDEMTSLHLELVAKLRKT